MIVDTDVLVWFMRGNIKAKKVLQKTGKFFISAVTYMELIQGMRNKKELECLKGFLRNYEVQIFLIDHIITNRAIFYMEEFFHGYNLTMADALIGATAIEKSETLLTGNYKHYKMLKGIKIKKFCP